MGIASREKVEKTFDRNLVIDVYLEEIARILKLKKRGNSETSNQNF